MYRDLPCKPLACRRIAGFSIVSKIPTNLSRTLQTGHQMDTTERQKSDSVPPLLHHEQCESNFFQQRQKQFLGLSAWCPFGVHRVSTSREELRWCLSALASIPRSLRSWEG